MLLCQVAKLRGAMVIGTVSTVKKEAMAKEAGADHVIRYTLHIGAEFPLAQAAEAHRALEGRETTGKVLLIP